MRGGPTILSGWAVGLSALATRVPERLLGGEGASSALYVCRLKSSSFGLWAKGRPAPTFNFEALTIGEGHALHANMWLAFGFMCAD